MANIPPGAVAREGEEEDLLRPHLTRLLGNEDSGITRPVDIKSRKRFKHSSLFLGW